MENKKQFRENPASVDTLREYQADEYKTATSISTSNMDEN